MSVSFGYTKELAQFWLKCGFSLVHLGDHLEASSGCYSAIALKGLSPQGIELEKRAKQSFQRNIPLSFHPLAQVFNTTSVDWELLDEDWLSLKNFAYFHRSLASALPAIRRFLMNLDETKIKKGGKMSEQEKKGWFRKAVDEYNKFCKELGLDKGACRGCMPRIEFDDDGHVKKEKPLEPLKK